MKSILLSILSGLLLILCFPRFDIEYLAWFALVPLLLAIRGRSLKSAFSLCFLAGFIFYWGVFLWFKSIERVSWIDFTSIVIGLSFCYYGPFGLCLNFISKRTKFSSIITAPVLWISLEYVRSHAGIVAHPQMLLGHSQHLNLPIIQISALTGAYGVSFLIVMVNVAISEVIHDRSKTFKPIIATVIILGISLVYGLSVITKGPGMDNVSITVVQANLPLGIKWQWKFRKHNLQKHVRLTKEASNNDNTSLIVWQESAVQGSFIQDSYLVRAISTLARETEKHLLFGSAQQPKFGSRKFKSENRFNSAFLISPAGKIVGQYNKIRLLPFNEYLPYKDVFPWPSKFVHKAGNFIHGTKYTIFNLDGARFGVTICWENTYPGLFRQFVKNGANFIVNITNAAHGGDTSVPYQMAAMSTFRAVENRISVVRCANTGISCFIDPYGKIIGTVHDHNNKETFVEGYLTKEIPLSHKRTFYTMYGDVFVYMNLIMATFMLALCFLKSKGLGTKAQRL